MQGFRGECRENFGPVDTVVGGLTVDMQGFKGECRENFGQFYTVVDDLRKGLQLTSGAQGPTHSQLLPTTSLAQAIIGTLTILQQYYFMHALV